MIRRLSHSFCSASSLDRRHCSLLLKERANIINARLNEETSALAKKQAAFQRNQRDNDGNSNAEEEFEMFCSEAMFRIQVKEYQQEQPVAVRCCLHGKRRAKGADCRVGNNTSPRTEHGLSGNVDAATTVQLISCCANILVEAW